MEKKNVNIYVLLSVFFFSNFILNRKIRRSDSRFGHNVRRNIFSVETKHYVFHDPCGGFNGADLKPIVIDIIQKAESIGLKVHCLASDMGPVNKALIFRNRQ